MFVAPTQSRAKAVRAEDEHHDSKCEAKLQRKAAKRRFAAEDDHELDR